MLGPNGIAAIFEWIEQLLIASLKRNILRHKDEEKRRGFSWSAWQAEKLKSIERFRRENRSIMSGFTGQIDTETRQLMQEQFAEGVNGAVPEAGEPAAPVPGEIIREPQFFGVDSERNRQLIEDICTLESKAETAALRLTDDVYRQTVIRVTLAMSTGSMTLAKAVDTAVQDFLDQGINCIVYKDGRRVNIADYVRMALRTAAARSAIEGKCAGYKALGFDTVAVSAYGMCSKTCEPWQGRVYIDDSFSPWSGETELREGIMWGRSGYCGKWFPLLSSAIEKGLFHPNCRHSVSLWRWGDPLPHQQDNTESERRYKLEQQQRALEREIRKAKRKVAGFTDPENIRQAKRELREAQKKLRDFIEQTNTAEGATILKRKPELEKVYEGELTGGAESGIIESVSEQQDFMDRSRRERLNRTVIDPKTGEKAVEEWSFRSNLLGGYSNISSQTYSEDARAMADYLNRKVNSGSYGTLDRIVIAKNESLKGISSYDHTKNTLYISEELITKEGFERLVDTSYFPARSLDDIITHELDGHKRHWDVVKKFYSDNLDRYSSLENAKQIYERSLRDYVVKQISYDYFYISKYVSKNAFDSFDKQSSLNELLADCTVMYRNTDITESRLFDIVKELMGYDAKAK